MTAPLSNKESGTSEVGVMVLPGGDVGGVQGRCGSRQVEGSGVVVVLPAALGPEQAFISDLEYHAKINKYVDDICNLIIYPVLTHTNLSMLPYLYYLIYLSYLGI